jgi:hypothetical protein
MFGLFGKIKEIIQNKYLASIVRNALQVFFGFLGGLLTVKLVALGISPEVVSSLVNTLYALQEPLATVLISLIGSLLTLGLSMLNAKKNSK